DKRFVIDQEIGRGASAFVFLVTDRISGARSALKLLRPELSHAISDARFVREMAIGKELRHPNILPIIECGSVEGRPYFTMPYISGESLRERLARQRQLPLHAALGIARQVAAALDYAHEKGVVHRDIKPGNLLLTGDQLLVADFGIARAMIIAPGEELTESGFSVGTPEYMSPEQISAERALDGRTDLYALGCVLYEMLAGAAPFTGPTAQATMARHHTGVAPSLALLHPEMSPSIDAAIQRALAKAPEDRYQTGHAFMTALDR
ncbi:MAG: serine/threonine-protein kinase, partial [Gemmatimonas sp.]